VKPRSSGTLTILLALGCAALVGIIYLELRAPPEQSLPVVPASSDSLAAPAAPSAFAMPPQETFLAIVERPVFSASRRPAPGSDQGGAGPQALSDVELIGIVVSGGDRFVLVRPSGASQPQPVHEGEMIAGWSVQAISTDHVTLRRGAEEMDVALDYAAPPPPSLRVQPPQHTSGEQGSSEQLREGEVSSPQEAPAQ
jgi:hypothetical protein